MVYTKTIIHLGVCESGGYLICDRKEVSHKWTETHSFLIVVELFLGKGGRIGVGRGGEGSLWASEKYIRQVLSELSFQHCLTVHPRVNIKIIVVWFGRSSTQLENILVVVVRRE